MNTLWQDLRYGARTLLQRRGFAMAAILTLALGIGANSAIFTVVNAVLLRPLPYPEPEQLCKVNRVDTRTARLGARTSPLNFLDWRSRSQSFEDLGGYLDSTTFNLSGGAEPERIKGSLVSDTLFPAIGVSPALGRNFLPEEDSKGGSGVAILSHQLWARRFNSDHHILGRILTLDGRPHTVVGVMPPGFDFPSSEIMVWVPFGIVYEDGGRGNYFVDVIGRLNPGVSLEQAQAEMVAIAAGLEREHPEENADSSVALVPLHEQVTGKSRTLLLVLFGAVGFVLLIACTNVANLLLARAASRQKEMAIRSALGASRFRIVRQLLSESALLSLAGGLPGLLVANWFVRAFVVLSPEDILRVGEISVDSRVLAFTFAVAVLTGLLFGLAPALQASRPNLNEVLKEGGRSASGGGSFLRHALVVAEVAMALVLLTGAGLLVRSFWRLLAVNPGFSTENILTFDVALPWVKYDREKSGLFFQQALERFAALPGVQAVGATTALPLSKMNNARYFTIEGRPGNSPRDYTIANHRQVTQSYLETLGIPLVKGRHLTGQDFSGTAPVAVVNQAFAHFFFPDQEALGKRLKMGETAGSPFPWMTIVGVVGDVRHTSLEAAVRPEFYRPFLHNRDTERQMTIAVRTAQPPEALTAAIRREVLELDRDQPIANVSTMEQLLDRSVARRRFGLLLLGVFAAASLALAGVGIYGVISYAVAQNTREIGIRMALGAQPMDILKLVVGQGMVMTLTGIAIGVGGAIGLTQLMTTLLYGVKATDPLTFAGVSVLLALVAFLACYLPARRAMKVNPVVALRYE